VSRFSTSSWVLGLATGWAITAVAFVSPAPSLTITHHGVASWYGAWHTGRPMANGERYNPDAMTAASYAWPLGTVVRVSAGDNSVVVTITDRGPDKRLGRLIDLSPAAFGKLAPLDQGLVGVTAVEVVK